MTMCMVFTEIALGRVGVCQVSTASEGFPAWLELYVRHRKRSSVISMWHMVTNICILHSTAISIPSKERAVCWDVQSRLPEGGGSECCTKIVTIVWLSLLHYI